MHQSSLGPHGGLVAMRGPVRGVLLEGGSEAVQRGLDRLLSPEEPLQFLHAGLLVVVDPPGIR